MTPKISVVLPVWNGEKHLAAAIDSVLAQTFTDFELIVVDDGSTDRSAAILASYTDERLQVHRLQHGGIVQALNFGVSKSRAPWIARQDADDVSLPERFARQWDALCACDRAVLCFSDVSFIGEWRDRAGHARLPRTKAFMALKLCYQSPIIHSSVLFRKEAFWAAGGYHPEQRHAEDYALWGRMLELGDFVVVPDPLLQFRVHSASVSKLHSERQSELTVLIGSEHCSRFMMLNQNDGKRAFALLTLAPHQRPIADWLWFLTYCVPRLRWKSTEGFTWLLWQTLKNLSSVARRSSNRTSAKEA